MIKKTIPGFMTYDMCLKTAVFQFFLEALMTEWTWQ